ncbi:MAG: hypothetical protein HY700_19005 [Gemmatimonadetes bacterium]|nr:hypothetical protein [Gemmatimonadota bacterium]
MRWSLVLPVAVFAAACADGNGPTTSLRPPLAQQAVACEVTVASRTMTCDSPSVPASPGLALNVILGGPQGRYVQLASTGTTYNSGTQAFTSSVTVQNTMAQPMGTTDGTTADPNGTRIFFYSGPTVTSGTGAVSVVGDGTATFTAPNQAYYQYDGVITPGSTSAAKTWTFMVPSTVNTFAFGVMVSTRLPDEAVVFRWEAMTPPAGDETNDFYHVATARGEVWASGANGKIIHYTDAGGWVEQLTGATGSDGQVGPIYGIYLWVSGDLIGGVAVGGSGSGIRLYYDGSNWTRQSSGTSTLMSTTGVGTDPSREWWACGLGGIVYRAYYPNAFFRFSPDFTTNDLYSCSGTATNDVFAAGANGFLAHFDGTGWTPYTTNTTQTIFTQTRCSAQGATTDMWLAGAGGVIRHAASPFTTLTEQASGTTETLYGMDAASCTDVYAVGSNGTILHYNGATWSAEASGRTNLLSEVVIRTKLDGTRDAFVVGSGGTILHGVR